MNLAIPINEFQELYKLAKNGIERAFSEYFKPVGQGYVLCNSTTKTYHPNTYKSGRCYDVVRGELHIKYEFDPCDYLYMTLEEALEQGYRECTNCKKPK